MLTLSVEWYDMIARRNGGYKSNAVFTVEGEYAEAIFEQELIKMLPDHQSVLDAGCGHGEFTLKMSRYAKSLTGFDHSMEMIKIAQSLLEASQATNVQFVYATTESGTALS